MISQRKIWDNLKCKKWKKTNSLDEFNIEIESYKSATIRQIGESIFCSSPRIVSV